MSPLYTHLTALQECKKQQKTVGICSKKTKKQSENQLNGGKVP